MEIKMALSDQDEKKPEPKFVCTIVSSIRPFTEDAVKELRQEIAARCWSDQFDLHREPTTGVISLWNVGGVSKRTEELAEAVLVGFSIGWRRALQ